MREIYIWEEEEESKQAFKTSNVAWREKRGRDKKEFTRFVFVARARSIPHAE